MLSFKKSKIAICVGALLGTALVLPLPALAQKYSEAPALAAKVAAGELPPVEERLPENPFVLTPIEMVGTYGGTWRSALKGTSDVGWLRRTLAYEPLVAFTIGWDDVVPNLAESFSANEDGTEFIFKLRKGHKWSDGTPFTAQDIVYGFSVVQNPDYRGQGNRPSLPMPPLPPLMKPRSNLLSRSPTDCFFRIWRR